MASRYISYRAGFQSEFNGQLAKRVKAASIYLSGQIRADISQPGTLRYTAGAGRSRFNKQTGVVSHSKGKQKTVYNFTHSRPGNPPFKQRGQLRRSLAYEVIGLVGRVGSSLKQPKYPIYLETGTRKMAPRPYLRAALMKHRSALVSILTRPVQRSELPPIAGSQTRSGHFGSGAKRAGF